MIVATSLTTRLECRCVLTFIVVLAVNAACGPHAGGDQTCFPGKGGSVGGRSMIQAVTDSNFPTLVGPSLLSIEKENIQTDSHHSKTDAPLKSRLITLEHDVEGLDERITGLEERLRPEMRKVSAAILENLQLARAEHALSPAELQLANNLLRSRLTKQGKDDDHSAEDASLESQDDLQHLHAASGSAASSASIEAESSASPHLHVSSAIGSKKKRLDSGIWSILSKLGLSPTYTAPISKGTTAELLLQQGVEGSSLRSRVKAMEDEMAVLQGRTHDLEGWLAGKELESTKLGDKGKARASNLALRIDGLEEEARVLSVKVSSIESRLRRLEESASGESSEVTDRLEESALEAQASLDN